MMNWLFWLELMARSSGLLLAGEVLRRLSGSQSAAFRYKLLLWSLLLLALLPVLSIVLPEIPVRLWVPGRTQIVATVTAQEISSIPVQTPIQRNVNWAVMIWLLGFFVASSPLVIGAISAWRVARRAVQFHSELPSPGTEILISKDLSCPLTCGFWRPRIVLPAAAVDWTSARLRAVLLHELAHVRRRDVAAQIAAHLIAALWWFQPMVWILRRSLRAESELASDAEALKSGFRPSAYAAELLGVAKTIRRDYPLGSFGISMARESDLERRVRVILKPDNLKSDNFKPGNFKSGASSVSRTCAYVLGAALAMVGVAASALTISPNRSFTEQGGSIMKRTLISGLLTSVGLSAATVSGSVHDTSGAAIANAAVLVFNPDTGEKQETATNADGKFNVNGDGAGQYILTVEKSGFASIFREFDLKAESTMDRNFTMTNEGAPADEDEGVTNEGIPKKTIRIGGLVAQSNLIKKVQPVYPTAAKSARTQGTVQIEAVISKDGVPVELRVVSTPSSDLAKSSLEAVRQWRYRPTLLNGEAVEIVTTIIVNYTLAP